MRRTITSLLLVAVATAGAPAGAQTDALVITRDTATFYPGGDDHPIPLVVQSGRKLLYQNLDTFQPHNVWSVDLAPDGSRLFRSAVSPTWNLGRGINPIDVVGVEALPPGSYGFYCDIHPMMRGTLTVL